MGMTAGQSAKLTVVGLGPGDAALLAPLARAALEQAEVVVGYTTYVDLVEKDLLHGKQVLTTGMMKEMDRVRAALQSAREGRRTVLVCGGDAGVYGLAGLALELAEQDGLLDRVEVEVVPGVPALAAAAALLGAPLTHDFAVISLSDLLTPWEIIELRVQAAASADFVIVLYNPASKRRTWQLPRALEIIKQARDLHTPLGHVRAAYRPQQEVRATTLGEFNPAEADMLSLLVVGNGSSRLTGPQAKPKMLTPRGYMAKYGPGS